MEATARRLVRTGDAELEVFLGGSGGPSICTTHHYLAHQDLARSARTAPFLDALAGAGRLVSVNPRGVGGSSPAATPDVLSMRRLVDDLEAARLALGGEPWVFAGATIGAMVGLHYALRYPRTLRGLIVSGGAPSWRFVEEPGSIYHPSHPRRRELDEAAALLHDPEASAADRRRWSELVVALSTHKEELLPAFLAGAGEDTVRPRLQAFGEEIRGRSYDVSDRLGEIAVPTLILCGRLDPQVPIRQSELLHDGIPHSELVAFEKSGHFPYAEEPEKFSATVRRFVRDL